MRKKETKNRKERKMSETKISSAAVRGIVSDSKFKLFHFYVIFLCFLIITGEGYNLFLYGSVLPLLTQEWSISPVQAGLIGSYGLIGMMFGSIIFGYIADKIGRKKVIMLSVVLQHYAVLQTDRCCFPAFVLLPA
jgi:MFS family permease